MDIYCRKNIHCEIYVEDDHEVSVMDFVGEFELANEFSFCLELMYRFSISFSAFLDISKVDWLPGIQARICERLRNPGIDSARLGIDFWAP